MRFLLTALLFPAVALSAAISPSLALASQPISNVTSLSGAVPNCVNTGAFPEWNGRIMYADCKKGIELLKLHSAQYANQFYGFYSAKNNFRPPPGGPELNWRLPTTTTFQTCSIQIRMARDFRSVEVPALDGTFLRPLTYPPAAISTWHSIIQEAEKILYCVRYGQPGWTSDGIVVQKRENGGPIGIFMWGKTSQIAREYIGPNAGGSGLSTIDNGTANVSEG